MEPYIDAHSHVWTPDVARYPLAEARISVAEVPGKPGSFNAVAHLRPWLQFEELTTSLRMVARIQGFPDDWQFHGRKTTAYRQVGNAFPPPVACAVARNLKTALSVQKIFAIKSVA